MASSASLTTTAQAAQFAAVTTFQGKPKSVTQSSFVGTKSKASSAALGISNGSSRFVCGVEKPIKDKWSSLGKDISDDQQDITRGKGMVDSLFQGASGFGTQDAIMSSYDYVSQGQRTFDWDNTKDGFYIAPAFMDKIVVHLAKNFMKLPNIKVPLILGVWGGKGQGKSFQSELIMSKLGINPIVMSAGELESGNAGEPAKLIRQRYREASDIIKKGKMCCLFINDLDAGAGRMGGTTQYTVNNQMVNATLMNIADNPTNVQLPGIYNKEEIPRVPIIVTGNDFSTLYAPLIRDGRMEKFYWAPTREDRIGVANGIFRVDNIPENEVVQLVDTFPGQSIDFFGALRARVYDDEVRKWVAEVGVENIGKKLVNSREGPPTFAQPKMTLNLLLKYGWMLVQEQENVKRVQLADEYLSGAALGNANDDADKGYYTGKAAQQFPPPVKEGCADPNAVNFDPTARSDDGSCVYDFSDAPKAAAAEYVQPSLDDIVPIIPKNMPVRGGRGRGGARSRSPSRSPAAASKGSSSSSNGDFSASSYYQEPSYTPEPEASLDDIVPIIPKNIPVRGGRGRGRARSRSPTRTPIAASQGEANGDVYSSFEDSTSYSAPEAVSLDEIVPIIPKNVPVRGGRGRGRARSRSPTRSPFAVAASNGDFYSAAEESYDSFDDIVPIIPKNLPVRGGRGRGRARSRSPSRTPAAAAAASTDYSSDSYGAAAVSDNLDDIVPIIPKNLPVRGGRGRGRARSRSPSRTPAAVSNYGEVYSTSYDTAAPESDNYLDSIVPIIPKNLPVRGARGRGRARSRSPSRSPVSAASNGYTASFDDSYSAPDSLDDIVPIIPKNLPVRGGRGRGRARSRSPSRTPIASGSSNGGFSSSYEDTYTVADSLDDIVPIIPKNLPVRGGRGRGRARSRSPSRSPVVVSTGGSNGGFTSSFDSVVEAPSADSLDDIVPIIPKNLPVRGARGRGGRARSRSPSRSPVAAVSESKVEETSSFDSFFPSDYYSKPAAAVPETSYFDTPAVVPRTRSVSPGPRGRGRGRGGRR